MNDYDVHDWMKLSAAKITLRKGVPAKLVDAFIALYSPFMSSAYKKRPNKAFTILSKGKPIGFAIFKKFPITKENKSDDYFLEMALDPSFAGKGIGVAIVKEILRSMPMNRVNWSVCDSNLPSLKMLDKMNGGIHGKYVASNGERVYKGYFRHGAEVDDSMRRELKKAIKRATPLYAKWRKHFDFKRKRKLTALAAILL